MAGFNAAEGEYFAEFVPNGVVLAIRCAVLVEAAQRLLRLPATSIVVQELGFTLEHHARVGRQRLLAAIVEIPSIMGVRLINSQVLIPAYF